MQRRLRNIPDVSVSCDTPPTHAQHSKNDRLNLKDVENNVLNFAIKCEKRKFKVVLFC